MSDERRVSLVTGGSRGIGRAVCLTLARPGDVVAFNHYDPDESAAEETVALLAERGVTAVGQKFDVSDQAAVTGFIEGVVSEYGRLDNLVNNAGITMDNLLIRMTPEAFLKVININLFGTFLCLQAAAKVMIKQRGGSIVNVASVVGQIGNVGQANYSASKAGVLGLTKTAAKELAGRGVRVNAVAPGFIETDMTASLPPKVMEAMKATIPLGRTGQAADVADVVAFLCSEAARYLTGQVLHVSGGMYM
ncbi:MAG: 3-oxoacyl-[acyl-carrier-protein] reductase [Deltaproteobacteria bacterium]|nr:3-oxoacyl-[acyl-carrier-protein] reductase [Deltaproteobacteria bacterium]